MDHYILPLFFRLNLLTVLRNHNPVIYIAASLYSSFFNLFFFQILNFEDIASSKLHRSCLVGMEYIVVHWNWCCIDMYRTLMQFGRLLKVETEKQVPFPALNSEIQRKSKKDRSKNLEFRSHTSLGELWKWRRMGSRGT